MLRQRRTYIVCQNRTYAPQQSLANAHTYRVEKLKNAEGVGGGQTIVWLVAMQAEEGGHCMEVEVHSALNSRTCEIAEESVC